MPGHMLSSCLSQSLTEYMYTDSDLSIRMPPSPGRLPSPPVIEMREQKPTPPPWASPHSAPPSPCAGDCLSQGAQRGLNRSVGSGTALCGRLQSLGTDRQ